MLPHDPNEPGDSTPEARSSEARATELPLADAPRPTGLVDQPIVTPVQAPGVQRRRSWPFAVSMVLVAVLGGGALFMSGYSVGRDQGLTPGSSSIQDRDAWQPFWDVYNAITTRYPLEPVNRTTLIEGAIRGLVESVGDPYSSYLSPKDYRGTIDDISGTFEGIGAEIGSVDAAGNTSDCARFGPDCHLVIIAPIEGSPAEKAGLKPGDVITSVDGSTLDGLTPDEARDRVRGKAGTEIKLHIQRFAAPVPASPGPSGSAAPTGSPAPNASTGPGVTRPPRQLLEEFDITLVRAKIQRREVNARELASGTVGYIHLSGFSEEGSKEVEAALKADLDKGISKLVLDLRGNPGGFLVDARRVASDFIADGSVYWLEDANGKQEQVQALGGGLATSSSIQVVVLLDRGTASASEIVAGALQDRGRAKLVGETSYGKGTVQEWLDLGQVGGVKLTVNKWLTPNKRWIHKVGLTPDIAVTAPPNNPSGSDPVLDRALAALGATGLAPGARRLAA